VGSLRPALPLASTFYSRPQAPVAESGLSSSRSKPASGHPSYFRASGPTERLRICHYPTSSHFSQAKQLDCLGRIATARRSRRILSQPQLQTGRRVVLLAAPLPVAEA